MQHPANNPADLARAISGFFANSFDKIWAIGRGSHPTPPAPPASHFRRPARGNPRTHPDRRGGRYSRRAPQNLANRPPGMHGWSHQRASPCSVYWNNILIAGHTMPRTNAPAAVVSARPPLNAIPPADLSRRTEDELVKGHSMSEGQGRLEEVRLKELPFYTHISNILLDSYLGKCFSQGSLA